MHHGAAYLTATIVLSLGAILNIGDAYSPKEKHKTADEVRKFAVTAFVLQGALAAWLWLS